MKNPFEKSYRREAHDKKEAEIENHEAEIEDIEAPQGHLETDDLFANMAHEALNAVLSIPKLPRRAFLKARVLMAKQHLQTIYRIDEAEAHRLNNKYNKIIERAAETGDDSERISFERDKLDMGDDSAEEAA